MRPSDSVRSLTTVAAKRGTRSEPPSPVSPVGLPRTLAREVPNQDPNQAPVTLDALEASFSPQATLYSPVLSSGSSGSMSSTATVPIKVTRVYRGNHRLLLRLVFAAALLLLSTLGFFFALRVSLWDGDALGREPRSTGLPSLPHRPPRNLSSDQSHSLFYPQESQEDAERSEREEIVFDALLARAAGNITLAVSRLISAYEAALADGDALEGDGAAGGTDGLLLEAAAKIILLSRRHLPRNVPPSVWRAVGHRLAVSVLHSYRRARVGTHDPAVELLNRSAAPLLARGPSQGVTVRAPFATWLDEPVSCQGSLGGLDRADACFRHVRHLVPVAPAKRAFINETVSNATTSKDACLQRCAEFTHRSGVLGGSAAEWCGGIVFRFSSSECRLLNGLSLANQAGDGSAESFSSRLGSPPVFTASSLSRRGEGHDVHLSLRSLRVLGFDLPPRAMSRRASLVHHHVMFAMLATASSIPTRVMPSVMSWLYPYKALLFFDDEGPELNGAVKDILTPFLSRSNSPNSYGEASLNGSSRWSQGGWPRRLSLSTDRAEDLAFPQGFKRCVFLKPPPRRGAKGIGGAWKNGQIVRYLNLLPANYRFPWYAIVDDDTFFIGWNFRLLFATLMLPKYSQSEGGDANCEGSVAFEAVVPNALNWAGSGTPVVSKALPHTPGDESSALRRRWAFLQRTCTVNISSDWHGGVASCGVPLLAGFRKRWGIGVDAVPMIHGGGGIFVNGVGIRVLGDANVQKLCSTKCIGSAYPHGDSRMGCCATHIGLGRFPIVPMVGSGHETPTFMKSRGILEMMQFPISFHRMDDTVHFASLTDAIGEVASQAHHLHVGSALGFEWFHALYEGEDD